MTTRPAQFELHDAGYVEETTYGTTPASPEYTEFQHNACSLMPKVNKMQSRRRLGNRMRSPFRLGKKSCDGNNDIEMTYGTHDAWLEALLGGRFPSSAFTQISAATLACVASSQEITDSGSGLGDIEVGDWIIIAGFTQNSGENNGVYHVSAATAAAITVEWGADAITDEAFGDTVTIDQQLRLEAGTDWDTPFTDLSGITFAAVASGQTITDSGTGMGDIAVGDWIAIEGFAAANNNGVFEVTAAAAGTITVASGSTLTDESVGPTVTIVQKIDRSFSVIGRYKDKAIYHLFKGVMAKTGAFSMVSDDICKLSIGLLGADFDPDASAPSSFTSAGSNEPFDALSEAFTEDGTAVCVTNVNLTVENNNVLSDKCLGTRVADNQSRGALDITGTLQFYFKDNTHITKWLAETAMAFIFPMLDPDGNQYDFGLPYCKLSELDLAKGEADIEGMEGYNLDAFEDPTTGVPMYVVKTAA